MHNKWNVDNIHILPLLSFRADNYNIVESTCIKLLIDRLDQIVNISSSQEPKYPINENLSEKIIEYIVNNKSSFKNIHILLSFFDPDAFKKNIKLLVGELKEKTKLTAYLEEKFCINSFLSDLIFHDLVHEWDGENVHALLQISCDSNLVQQICALVKIQNDLGIWDTQKKYHIKNKINKLLQENIPEKVDCINLRDDDLDQIDTIDPTYVGMNLTSKLLVRGGFLGVSIAGVLLSRKTVSPQLSKILLGVSAVL